MGCVLKKITSHAISFSMIGLLFSIEPNPSTPDQIPGSRVVFGGKRLTNHSIPDCYGAWEPTAVYVPLEEMLKSKETFELATTEIFGPFQVRKDPGLRRTLFQLWCLNWTIFFGGGEN